MLRGWRGGVAAAALVGASSFVEVVQPTSNTVTNSIFGLLLGGCFGYCVDLARASHATLQEAMRRDAARAERDRLARTVHDGVLQTLSFIHRRGTDLGGETAVLGAMAGEQERILRTLVSSADLGEVDRAVSGDVDLRASLRHTGGDGVHLVAPADPILLPRRVSDEVVAAVEAALDNVRKHAGDRAEAWVLLDDDGGDIRSPSVTRGAAFRPVASRRPSDRGVSGWRRASVAASPTSAALPASAAAPAVARPSSSMCRTGGVRPGARE